MTRLIIRLLFGNSFMWIVWGLGALVAGFFGWLALHDHNLWNQAMDGFNKQQEQVVEQKQQEFEQKTEDINTNADHIKHQIDIQNEAVAKQSEEMLKKASEEAKGTNQASPYLKNIIKQLNGVSK